MAKTNDRIVRIVFWLLIGLMLGIFIDRTFIDKDDDALHPNSDNLSITISNINDKPTGKICIVIDDFGTDKNYSQYFEHFFG